MSSGFLKALGVLAKSPSLNRYLNVLKPAEEGISRGMDYFNNAVKKVVDEGDEIEKTLNTKVSFYLLKKIFCIYKFIFISIK